MSNISIIRTKIQDLKRSIKLEKQDLKKFKPLPENKINDMKEDINIQKRRLLEMRLELIKAIPKELVSKRK